MATDLVMVNEQFGRSDDSYANTVLTLGDLDNTNRYIPTLYAKKVLYDFYASTVWAETTNTDYEGQFKSMGDIINIRNAPTMTVNDYSKGLTLTYQVPGENATTMVIDYGKYCAFEVDDVDVVQMDVDYMNMCATDAAQRLAIQVDGDVLTAMAGNAHASNTGTTAGAISSNINLGAAGDGTNIHVDRTNALDKLVDLSQALDEQNIPQDGRFCIIPAWYASRLKLSDLKAADFTGDNTGTVRTGLIGMINGCKVYVNNNIYSTATGETEYHVICSVKLATSFAMQLSKIDTLKITESFGEYWRQLWVYGIKVVRTEAMAQLICTPG